MSFSQVENNKRRRRRWWVVRRRRKGGRRGCLVWVGCSSTVHVPSRWRRPHMLVLILV